MEVKLPKSGRTIYIHTAEVLFSRGSVLLLGVGAGFAAYLGWLVPAAVTAGYAACYVAAVLLFFLSGCFNGDTTSLRAEADREKGYHQQVEETTAYLASREAQTLARRYGVLGSLVGLVALAILVTAAPWSDWWSWVVNVLGILCHVFLAGGCALMAVDA